MSGFRSIVFSVALVVSSTGCLGASDSSVEVQPAIWSSMDSTADSPEGAATAAVQALIGVTPLLSEFMAGDNRSGEMIIFSPRETTPVERSLLLLRQLGPGDQWSVIRAFNSAMRIDEPASASVVPAGILTVSGRGRGFEALVVVTAHRISDHIELIDREITTGGSLGTSEPFSVELDLSDTDPGDVIAIVVRGGVGIENDPGEFSAIPIRIAD